jgi:hypothetical protein
MDVFVDRNTGLSLTGERMEPIPNPAASSAHGSERTARFSLRYMWQVPLFFVGVVSVVTVILTRGLVAPDPVRKLHHQLTETRRLLHLRDADPEETLRQAQQVVDNLMYDPTRAPEAFYLLGSAHILMAERESGVVAIEHWREAKQNLQEAEERGLAGDDLNRQRYRLAKAVYHLGDNSTQMVERIKNNLDGADDRAEALNLLTQAYLHTDPPNLKKALETNKLLREVPQVGEEVLGPAKLAGAKLLLQLNQREEARKTLEKIREQAPPSTLAEKNMLLAGLYQEERKWAEAAALWRAVLDERGAPQTEAGSVLYNLGYCYSRLDQPAQAGETWSECLRRSHGEEAQAAALALAELRLKETNPEKGVALLTEAVANVRKGDDWKNALVDLANVRELFEKAMSAYRKLHRYDLAVQTAELYERVAVAPQGQLRRAELNAEWARSLRERAQAIKDEAAKKKDETNAEELLRHAAEAHSEAAKLLSDKEKRADQEWLSAVCSYEGHDYPRAAAKLKVLVESLKDNVDRQSEGWFLLGQTCRQLNDLKSAEAAYKACAELGAAFTYRARYELAMLAIDARDIDGAVRLLEQNILLEIGVPDAEAQEKSRLALCALLYQSAASFAPNYRRVVQYLEGHLDQLAVSPETVRARFQLADSHRLLAAQNQVNRTVAEKMNAEAQDHYLQVNRSSWKRAAEEFAKVEEQIQDADKASLLSVKQQVDVPFRVAECYYNLGEYEKSLRIYESLAEKKSNSPLALRALSDSIRCYFALGDSKQMLKRAEEIQRLLASTEGLSDKEREQWNAWLRLVTTQLPEDQRERKDDEPRIINRRGDESQSREDAGPVIKSGGQP